MKKSISWKLLGLLLLTLLLGAPVQAAPTAHSRDEAVAWLRSIEGQKFEELSPEYAYQCVDLVNHYYKYLGFKAVHGNGGSWGSTERPGDWALLPAGTPPEPGDIAWNVGENHVYIVLSNNGSSNQGLHQNVGGMSVGCHILTKPNSYISGIIRPNWTTPPPQTPVGHPIGGGEQLLSDGDYHIVSAMNEKRGLDAAGAENKNGTNVWLWDTTEEAHQVFTIKWLGDGFYSIIHRKTGKSLDVDNASLNYKTNVQLFDQNNSDAQKWVIRQSNDGRYFKIYSKCNGLCIDADGGIDTNGTNIQVYGDVDTTAQKWKFIAWGDDIGQTVADGRYEIVTAMDNNKALDVPGGITDDGTTVWLWDRTGGNNQKWDVKYLGKGYYTIIGVDSGKSLDMEGNKHASGTNVQIATKNGTDAQQWIIKSTGDGYYKIICKGSGLNLDAKDGLTANGTNIHGWVGFNIANQKWKFVKADEQQQPDPDPTPNPDPVPSKCSVSVSASPSEGGNVTGNGSFDKGTSVSVSASPNSGFKFAGWYNGDQKVSDDAQYSFYVSANTSLTAKFEKTDGKPDPVPNPSGTTTIYRLYNNVSGEHLYTISQEEVQALTGSSDWNYEGVGWNAPNSGTAVYRLYNPGLADHLYTTDQNEVKELTANNGWQLDFAGEPIFYSGGSKPIYRLYNATSGRHHLTTDEFEYSLLPQNGWTQEGPKLNCVS